jgi:hypothetical protein
MATFIQINRFNTHTCVSSESARRCEACREEKASRLSPMARRVQKNKSAERRFGGERPMGWQE